MLDFGPINRAFKARFLGSNVAKCHLAFTWKSSLRDSISTRTPGGRHVRLKIESLRLDFKPGHTHNT